MTQALETPFAAQYDQIDLQTTMNEGHGSIPGASTNTTTQHDQLNIQNGINEVYTGLPLAKSPSAVRQPRLNPLAQPFAPTQQPHSPADNTLSVGQETQDDAQSTADRAGTSAQVVSTPLVADPRARTSTACVRCHRRRTKCDHEVPCQPCVKSGSSCTPHVSLVGIRTKNACEPCYTGRTRCPGGMPCHSCEEGGLLCTRRRSPAKECGPCSTRRTKCTGGMPCQICVERGVQCTPPLSVPRSKGRPSTGCRQCYRNRKGCVGGFPCQRCLQKGWETECTARKTGEGTTRTARSSSATQESNMSIRGGESHVGPSSATQEPLESRRDREYGGGGRGVRGGCGAGPSMVIHESQKGATVEGKKHNPGCCECFRTHTSFPGGTPCRTCVLREIRCTYDPKKIARLGGNAIRSSISVRDSAGTVGLDTTEAGHYLHSLPDGTSQVRPPAYEAPQAFIGDPENARIERWLAWNEAQRTRANVRSTTHAANQQLSRNKPDRPRGEHFTDESSVAGLNQQATQESHLINAREGITTAASNDSDRGLQLELPQKEKEGRFANTVSTISKWRHSRLYYSSNTANTPYPT